MMFMVFNSLCIKTLTFLHGFHGLSFPGNTKPQFYMVFMVFLCLGIKNHTLLHSCHGFLDPGNKNHKRFYLVFMVFLFLITKNHKFLHGYHGFSFIENHKPYVFYMVFFAFAFKPYGTICLVPGHETQVLAQRHEVQIHTSHTEAPRQKSKYHPIVLNRL